MMAEFEELFIYLGAGVLYSVSRILETPILYFNQSYVLMAERKDNSDRKTMFGLFLLVRTSLLR